MVGMYSVWLKRWLEVFPRDQILILRNEDYSADTATHLVQVFRFLELGEYIAYCSASCVPRLQFRSCVKVEVAVLGSPSLVVCRVSVDVRHH